MATPGVDDDDLLPELTAVPAVILFSDVVEYDRLLQANERRNAARVLSLLKHCAVDLAPAHGGRCRQRVGDGLVVQFARPRDAVACARALHGAAFAASTRTQGDLPLTLRIGISLGHLLTGAAVAIGRCINLAARLCKLGQPGQTIVSDAVRDELTDGIDAAVEDLGECLLLGSPVGHDLGECYVKHEATVRAYRLDQGDGASPQALPPADELPLKPTLAVIPLSARDCDGEHAVLGEVLADEMIVGLSRCAELRVMSRLTTSNLRGRGLTPQAVRSAVGADYVLSGDYRVLGDRLHAVLELSDARDASIVWSRTVREPVAAVLAGESTTAASAVEEVSRSIVQAQVAAARSAPLPSLRAYTLLFAGIGLMHRTQRSDFDRARELLAALGERFPRHALPRAWLAAWHVFKVTQGWFDDLEREARIAQSTIDRALDCNQNDALALAIRGLVQANLRRDLPAAWASYDHAIKLNPSESLARLHRGTLAAFEDRGGLATEDTELALGLSPLDPWKYYYDSLSATAALSAQNYPRAEALARRSLRANRTHASTWRALAIACAEMDQLGDAQAAIAELLKLDPGLTVSRWFARTPSAGFATGQRWASALRKAGLPS